jgi:Zn-dependent hydrolases, including glyoxylases
MFFQPMLTESAMIFRQLFEPVSSTYTYLIGCEETGQALLIDPVLPTWERDLAELKALGMTLAYTVETHIHADHITSAKKLKEMTGSRIAGPARRRLAMYRSGHRRSAGLTEWARWN